MVRAEREPMIGSGKTFLLIPRYFHVVENGLKKLAPHNIPVT